MIDLETIEREINELEARGDTTYSLCERLSWLYIVRDHLVKPIQAEAQVTDVLQGSDFLEAASGVDYADLMGVLDEHMEALKVVMPRQYDAVMEKIRALR